jgi:hypothetical protein
VSGQTCTTPDATATCNSDVTSDTFTFQAVGKSGKAIFYETAKGADSGFTIAWAKLAEVTSTTTNQTVQQQQGALASQDFQYMQDGGRITLYANIQVGNGNSAPTVYFAPSFMVSAQTTTDPVTGATVAANSLKFAVQLGNLAADGNSVTGSWPFNSGSTSNLVQVQFTVKVGNEAPTYDAATKVLTFGQ